MDNQTQNNVTPQNISTMPTGNTMPPAPEKASTSGIIGTVIIIALIVLGGLYFWGKRINLQKENAMLIKQEQTAAQEASVIQAVSTQDDTATLKAELDATQTSGLGTELQ